MRPLALALAIALAAALATPAPAPAHEITEGALTIVHPMSRPILEGRPGAAYMTIVNEGDEAERLLGARAPDFEAAELHESYEEDGVSKMRPVEAVEIPAGDTVLLAPGGLHLMLFGAGQGFAAGDRFPLVLIFENAGEIEVPVAVDEMSAGGGHGHDHGHEHGHGDHTAPAE